MPSIISLNGSPVKGSSTEILLGEIARGIRENSEYDFTLESFRLHDLKYEFCQSCGFSPEPEYCIFNDDLTPIYKKLVECDIILIGSPIYFDSVSGQTKKFIDRCNCLRPLDFNNETDEMFKKILPKKRLGAMALVGGDREVYECARKVIAGWFKWIWVENFGRVVYAGTEGNEVGPVRNDEETLSRAFSLGADLSKRFAEAYASDMG